MANRIILNETSYFWKKGAIQHITEELNKRNLWK